MKITPDLIPHEQFHLGNWLQSTERPSWYYFQEAKVDHSISNKDFLKSVDGPLKELVKYLHKNKIETTPSCSGHHISEKNFETIYSELKHDARVIRGRGLNLRNVESGEIVFYKNPKYKLPWIKREFLRKIISYQQKGVLGIKTGKRKLLVDQLLKMKIEGVTVEQKGSVLFIFTDGKSVHIPTTWKKITSFIKKLVI